MIKCIIVDDKRHPRDSLELLLSFYFFDKLKVCGYASFGKRRDSSDIKNQICLARL